MIASALGSGSIHWTGDRREPFGQWPSTRLRSPRAISTARGTRSFLASRSVSAKRLASTVTLIVFDPGPTAFAGAIESCLLRGCRGPECVADVLLVELFGGRPQFGSGHLPIGFRR